jgi:hypothetical protein
MLVPLVWAVTLPELPEIWTTHVRARRWWKRSRCPSCGYQIEGSIDNERTCPECGVLLREPEGYRISARTIRMFIALNVLAWIIGCAAGEVWLLRDELAFRRRCARGVLPITEIASGSMVLRPRVWPNNSSMLLSRQVPAFSHSHSAPMVPTE